MSYSRIKQPSVFETRCQDVLKIFDDFTKSCIRRAKYWQLQKDEAENIAQESIQRVLENAKNKVVDDEDHCLNRLLNKTCFRVRMDVYNAKRYRNSVKIKEVSMKSSAEEMGSGPIANYFYAPEASQVNVLILYQINEAIKQVLETLDPLDQAIWSLTGAGEKKMKKKDMALCLGINSNTFNSRNLRLKLKIKAAIQAMDFEYFEYAANDDVQRSAYLINEGIDLHLERAPARRRKNSKTNQV